MSPLMYRCVIRLGPGEMLSVDLNEGKLLLNDAVKHSVASQRPYKKLVEKSVLPLKRLPFQAGVSCCLVVLSRSLFCCRVLLCLLLPCRDFCFFRFLL